MAQLLSFENQLQELSEFFQNIMEKGMQGKAGVVWPVIIRRWVDGRPYIAIHQHFLVI